MMKIFRTHQYVRRPLLVAYHAKQNTQSGNIRQYSSDESSDKPDPKGKSTVVTSKYEVFRDEGAPIILDIEEERERLNSGIETIESIPSAYAGLNLERGKTGVFDLEDLVQVLRRDNAQDIFVCKIPKEMKYVSYMCVVHGRSVKHMQAMSEFVRKIYKLKRNKSDHMFLTEGTKNTDWIAMDLGNIALHIFSLKARERYDIESLWTLGVQYDREANKKTADDILDMYERHTASFLHDLTAFQRKLGEDETPFDIPVDEHGNPIEPVDSLRFPSETKSS